MNRNISTRLIKALHDGQADAGAIAAAGAVLRDGGLVAFATETVYGLGADATQAAAVARLYAAKGRPSFNPLIAHVASFDEARAHGVLDARAEALAAAFWPGPLTLVVPRRPGSDICDLATAGLASVALRMPAHPLALALIGAVGRPVVAPSANRSGHVSPTTAAHVMSDLSGRIDLVLDGGATPVGVESTIVACLPGRLRLLRPGAVLAAAMEAAAGEAVETGEPESGSAEATPIAPGLLASHYAPNARVRLDADAVTAGEAVLDFGGRLAEWHDRASAYFDLSPKADPVEAAARLFAGLRELDASGAVGIAVAPIPDDGLGAAILDRLRRAAAPRG
ncbi:MAG: threonylcarbamoyl-AMP synthase [Hyphomicrobiaceae bacterium]|nr:threonylcarbamoyl-AMP synthase [Hyphomicrobiaceae bacterium]